MAYKRVLHQAMAAAAIAIFSSTAAADHLTSLFEFEGNTNDTVAGNPAGTLVDFNPGNAAPALGPGKIGSGLNLPFGDVMQTTTAGSPTEGDFQAGTFALWIKTSGPLTSGDLSNKTLWGNLNANDSTAYLFGTNGVGNLQLFPRAADGSQVRPRVAPGGDVFAFDGRWADGEWHHLAVTFTNGASNGETTGQWYVDGQQLDTQIADQALNTGDVFTPWEFEMTIGARNNRGSLDQFLPGGMMLDDIRVYSRALSQQEILALPGLIPEPASLIMLATGGLVGCLLGRRKLVR